jgi:hypothetical protein
MVADKAPSSTRASPRAKIISRCRTIIQENLGALSCSAWILYSDLLIDEILHENNIEKKGIDMNYRNYKGKIVEKYGVALKGWLTGIPGVCNPSAVGSWPMLQKLLSALESSQCCWVVLTEDELEARKKDNQARDDCGEQIYKLRKSVKRPRTSKAVKSAAIVDDSDEEDEDGSADAKHARNSIDVNDGDSQGRGSDEED